MASPDPPGSLIDGRVTVPTPGLPQPLLTTVGTAFNMRGVSIIIQPLRSNTGLVSVGAITTRATPGAERGYTLAPTDPPLTVSFEDPRSIVYIDAQNAGDGVSWLVGV